MKALRDRLEQGVLQQIPHTLLNGEPDNRLPNTANIAFEYLDGEAVLTHLNRAGIATSTGSPPCRSAFSSSIEPPTTKTITTRWPANRLAKRRSASVTGRVMNVARNSNGITSGSR